MLEMLMIPGLHDSAAAVDFLPETPSRKSVTTDSKSGIIYSSKGLRTVTAGPPNMQYKK